jgi:hypothetical protein
MIMAISHCTLQFFLTEAWQSLCILTLTSPVIEVSCGIHVQEESLQKKKIISICFCSGHE